MIDNTLANAHLRRSIFINKKKDTLCIISIYSLSYHYQI